VRDTSTQPQQHSLASDDLDHFVATVWDYGRELYRDLPWRDTRDPYEVLVSEVMLQQTQVSRVLDYWPRWLERLPSVDSLSAAPTSLVLSLWQGLGYNRRAVNLKRAAEICSEQHGGTLPRTHDELLALPGIGPATAAGVRVFAYNQPDIYIETNVRAVVLHELFPQDDGVPDRVIADVLAQTCDVSDPRGWYYALLDYGAYLKRTVPNPSRRSKVHARQSAFEGSRRQKRAWLLRAVLASPGLTESQLAEDLDAAERDGGREPVDPALVSELLCELGHEHFIMRDEDGSWRVVE
jgi:A/G-specific adenine glycosylase